MKFINGGDSIMENKETVLKEKLEALMKKMEADKAFGEGLLACEDMKSAVQYLKENGMAFNEEELLELSQNSGGIGDTVKKLLTEDELEAASGGYAGIDDFIAWLSKKVSKKLGDILK